MANSITYSFPSYGIEFELKYITTPESMGGRDYWENALKKVFWFSPFKNAWSNYFISYQHLDHPDLDPLLIDYRDDIPGIQRVEGTTNNRRTLLKGYPIGYWDSEQSKSPNPDNPRDISRSSVDRAKKVFFHEAGHWYARTALFFGAADIQIKTREAFHNLFKDEYKTGYKPDQTSEQFAEVFMCVAGDYDTYRNGEKHTISDELKTLIRLLYWLNVNLSSKTVIDFQVHEDCVWWCERTGVFWWNLDTWYKLDFDYVKYKWTGTDWRKI